MTTVENTVTELKQRFTESHMQPITVTVKCNGDVVRITPCFDYSGIKSLAHVEYWLVSSPSLPWLGGEKLDTVAKQLNDYERLLIEKADDERKLAEARKTLLNPGNMSRDEWEERFEFYSDFYKDVYGHRPRDIPYPWATRS